VNATSFIKVAENKKKEFLGDAQQTDWNLQKAVVA